MRGQMRVKDLWKKTLPIHKISLEGIIVRNICIAILISHRHRVVTLWMGRSQTPRRHQRIADEHSSASQWSFQWMLAPQAMRGWASFITILLLAKSISTAKLIITGIRVVRTPTCNKLHFRSRTESNTQSMIPQSLPTLTADNFDGVRALRVTTMYCNRRYGNITAKIENIFSEMCAICSTFQTNYYFVVIYSI